MRGYIKLYPTSLSEPQAILQPLSGMYEAKEVIEMEGTISGRYRIAKTDEDKHLAFGWASIALDKNGNQLTDYQKDQIDPEELEKAAYGFVQFSREGGEMHQKPQVATCIESMVFTKEKQKALGIPDGVLPVGWWLGFKVQDEEVWKKIKSGEYSMFSIEGKGTRVPVEK